MLSNIGLYSYGAAFLAYVLLTVLALLSLRGRLLGVPLLVASALTAVWGGVIAGSTLLAYPQVNLMHLAEVARNAAWSFLLLKLIGARLQGSDHLLASNRWIPWFAGAFTLICAALFATPSLSGILSLSEDLSHDVAFAAWLAMAILGLLLLEQIYRNSTEAERWSNKHLCLGLGFIFTYDFFMYAEALLFRNLDPTLWQARGIVVTLAAIFIAIAVGRIDHDKNTRSLQVSRHVAFHSVTLLAAGIYLIMMALIGYFIRYLGGSWGGVLQITFLCAAGLLLLTLLFSGRIRAHTQVWLSKNFFSYKYDYRTEWLQFTQALAGGSDNVPANVIRVIANLANSPGGLLWSRTEDGQFEFSSHRAMAEPDIRVDLRNLPDWLQETEWIIDLQEWRSAPDMYDKLELPKFFQNIPRAWLVVPLMFGARLQGILLLRESGSQQDINWEDRDLLKVAGRQAASHLAQHQASEALMESRQFEAFNRLSAYVVHDLKNILAQQSLIVSNAEKHKNNPAFVDDVINTVRNSVQRMTRLMEQMRSGGRSLGSEQVSLAVLLRGAVHERQSVSPAPQLQTCQAELWVEADPEQLATVFTHIIQNAQEATAKNGRVNICLLQEGDRAVVEIKDDGSGMDEEFLRNRLFKPFDSTKGLTGMGIGAFESREFVRELGGDITVTSAPEVGSQFRIVLPCSCDLPKPKLTTKETLSE